MTFNYHQDLIQRVINRTSKSAGTLLLLTFVYIYMYINYIPLNLLILWTILQTIFIFLRFLNRKNLKISINENNIKKTRKNVIIFTILIFCSSSIMTFGAVLGAIYAPSPFEFVMALLLVGTITAGTLSILPIYYAYLIYFFMLVIPQIFIMLYFNDKVHFITASLLVLYTPLIFLLSKSIYNNMLTTISTNEELKKNSYMLHTLSIMDSLTNIYNRKFFLESAENYINIAKRQKENISLLVLNIDYFKRINDKLGHQIGDCVLKEFVTTTKNHLRKSDIFARIAGEEFAILLPHTSQEGAEIISKKTCSTIREKQFLCPNKNINFTVSIGVGILDNNQSSLEDIFRRANANLYEAKILGKDRVVSTQA